jgi:hypothetical protein
MKNANHLIATAVSTLLLLGASGAAHASEDNIRSSVETIKCLTRTSPVPPQVARCDVYVTTPIKLWPSHTRIVSSATCTGSDQRAYPSMIEIVRANDNTVVAAKSFTSGGQKTWGLVAVQGVAYFSRATCGPANVASSITLKSSAFIVSLK